MCKDALDSFAHMLCFSQHELRRLRGQSLLENQAIYLTQCMQIAVQEKSPFCASSCLSQASSDVLCPDNAAL